MKVLALLLFVSVAFADVSDVEKQRDVLEILYKVYGPLRKGFAKLHEAAHSYKPTDHLDDYTDGGKAVTELADLAEHGHRLGKKLIFSLFNDDHRHEAILIFDALYFSKDWDTLIKTAAYYRETSNPRLFVYAFYTTIIHSKLSLNIVNPPLYEIAPHLFANTKVIRSAYDARIKQESEEFVTNFTGSPRNVEHRVAYFGEDIGLNVHHVTWHKDFPFWWDGEKYGHHIDRKGELFFWAHHQLNARYDAERLSNNLDFVEELQWNKPIVTGFAPHIAYRNGESFPSRTDNVDFEDVDGIASIYEVQAFETRIRDAIAHGYVDDQDGKKVSLNSDKGIEIVGDLLESSEDSVNKPYFGSLHNLAHIILGRQGDPHGKFNLPPSVTEHFETATRDPEFFRLHRHLDKIFKEQKDKLPAYQADDVAFAEVSVDNVEVEGNLVTFFEDFKFSLDQSLDDSKHIDNVDLTAHVQRINHEDFSLKFHVTNNGADGAVGTFRVYLTPTKDFNGVSLCLDEKRWRSIEVDKFWHKLSSGSNTIVRKSADSSVTVPDLHSFDHLLKSVEKGELPHLERSCGFPNRFLLPKGTPAGLEFELFVAVTDAKKDGYTGAEGGTTHAQCGIHGEKYPETRPLGFPLDRRIEDQDVIYDLPNVFTKTVKIVHHENHHV